MFDPVLFAALMGSTALFSPSSLFSAGEQGAWYDPSDFSTMFQDSAGTTPVTAVEQPVGLLLDKSKGLVLGSDLVTNGDFSGGSTGWTITGESTISGGAVNIISTAGTYSAVSQVFTVVAGKFYKIEFDIVSVSSGTISIDFYGTNNNPIVTSTGRKSIILVAASTAGSFLFKRTSGVTNVTIDNISVRELPGNHASQSTSASRPVLSARVNLLTYSEQFDNAAWSKGGLVTTGMANVTTAPDGTTTADQLIETATTAAHYAEQSAGTTTAATNYTASVAIKANGRQYGTVAFTGAVSTAWVAATFDLSSGGSVSKTGNGTGATYVSSSIVSLGNGWFRCTVTGSHTANTTGIVTVQPSNSGTPTYSSYSVHAYTGDGTSGIYIWGADLRVTNDGVGIPAYQRVGAAVTATTNPAVTGVPDYDTSGFPLYLRFDGTDDSLATASIDFSATDKMSVFAGVRKLSDIGDQAAIETSSAASANNGTISLFAPVSSGTNYNFGSRGTTFRSTSATGFAAPITTVVTGLSDISGDSVVIRANGSQASSSILDQGTGNYGNYPLYIGRRNNATLPYNGRLYSLIVRGAQSTTAQIASTETWVNNVTKGY